MTIKINIPFVHMKIVTAIWQWFLEFIFDELGAIHDRTFAPYESSKDELSLLGTKLVQVRSRPDRSQSTVPDRL